MRAEARMAEAGIEVEAMEAPTDSPTTGCPYQPDVRWQGVGVSPGEDPMAVVVWISPPGSHGRKDSEG